LKLLTKTCEEPKQHPMQNLWNLGDTTSKQSRLARLIKSKPETPNPKSLEFVTTTSNANSTSSIDKIEAPETSS
jgi:hypothetical protein